MKKYPGPLIFQEYAEDLSRRVTVTNGGVVLETAAGTGLATRQLRAAIPKDVRIVTTDLNGDMLKFAEENLSFMKTWNFKLRTQCIFLLMIQYLTRLCVSLASCSFPISLPL